MTQRLLCLLALSFCLSIGTVEAQLAPTATRDADGHLVIHAARLTSPISLDGKLTEEIYGLVEPAATFIQQDPDPGKPTTERTEAWVFYDDRAIYVSVRCWE